MVEVTLDYSGDRPIRLSPSADGSATGEMLVLDAGGKQYGFLGQAVDPASYDPLNFDPPINENTVIVDEQVRNQTVTALFLVPEKLKRAKLTAPDADAAPIDLSSALPADPTAGKTPEGDWKFYFSMPVKSRFDNMAINHIRAAMSAGGSGQFVVAPEADGFSVNIGDGKVTGTLKPESGKPGYYTGSFTSGAATADASVRHFDGGDALLVSFGDDIGHQFHLDRVATE